MGELTQVPLWLPVVVQNKRHYWRLSNPAQPRGLSQFSHLQREIGKVDQLPVLLGNAGAQRNPNHQSLSLYLFLHKWISVLVGPAVPLLLLTFKV